MTNDAIASNQARLERAVENADLLWRWLSTVDVASSPDTPTGPRLQISRTETADPTFDAVSSAEAQLDAIVRRIVALQLGAAYEALDRDLVDDIHDRPVPSWCHPLWRPRLRSTMTSLVESLDVLHRFYADEFRTLQSVDDGGDWVHGAGKTVVDADADLRRLVRDYVPPEKPPKIEGCRPPWCTGEVVYPGVSGGLCRLHYMQHYRRRRRRKARRAG